MDKVESPILETYMIGDLKIVEIKPLAGPDRLLRMHVMFENAFDLKTSITMLGVVVAALIAKYHNLNIEFPTMSLFDALPSNPHLNQDKYGEWQNGVLGINVLIMRRSNSVFKMRYYANDLEFQRKLMAIDSYVAINKIDMNKYHYQFTIEQLRNGIEMDDFITKVTYQ